MPIYEDNTKSIGRTPLVRINRLDASSGATILAKIEGRNPAYSVKCRIGAAMVWDAEERGALKPGMSHRRGDERQHRHCARLCGRVARLRMRAHHARNDEHGTAQGVDRIRGETGADTPGAKGMKGAIAKAEELAAADPGEVSC